MLANATVFVFFCLFSLLRQQPQGAITKDMSVKLNEAILNISLLQDQMSIKDKQISDLNENVQILQVSIIL